MLVFIGIYYHCNPQGSQKMRTSYEFWLVLLFEDFTAFHIARNAL